MGIVKPDYLIFGSEFINYVPEAVVDHDLGLLPIFPKGFGMAPAEIVALRANMKAVGWQKGLT